MEELDTRLYYETPWTSASMWSFSSMTTVGAGIYPRVYLIRRGALENGLKFNTELAKHWFIKL